MTESTPKPRKKAVSFALSPDLNEWLSILAYQFRTSKSSLVEEWLFEKVEYYRNMEAEYGKQFKNSQTNAQ